MTTLVNQSPAVVGAGWEQCMTLTTASGQPHCGFLAADGRHVWTSASAGPVTHVSPAFADRAVAPGPWPAVAMRQCTLGILSCIEFIAEHVPVHPVAYAQPKPALRALAPMRRAGGAATWSVLGFLGEVPPVQNTLDCPLHVARVESAFGRPVPGTPVFRAGDSALLGIVVPGNLLGTPPPSVCVVAEMEGALTLHA